MQEMMVHVAFCTTGNDSQYVKARISATIYLMQMGALICFIPVARWFVIR